MKSLCFHCDEKWVVGHQCKVPRVFLLEWLHQQLTRSMEEETRDNSLEEVSVQLQNQQAMVKRIAQVTLYALVGSPTLGTMSSWYNEGVGQN